MTKLTIADHPSVTPIQGDATNGGDVASLIDGADVVVSCVGNPNRSLHIMEATANNVLAAAVRQPEPPRCIFISSIGVGGSSWLIGAILRIIGRDKAGFADYEAADHRIRNEKDSSSHAGPALRPHRQARHRSLPGHHQIPRSTSPSPSPAPTSPAFLLDATTDPQWDGPRGIQLTGT